MGEKTRRLVEELSDILVKAKNLLLEGGLGVGKTYLAKEIAKNLGDNKYVDFPLVEGENIENSEVYSEVISVHQSLNHADFFSGIVTDVKSERLIFETKDKIFLIMLSMALESWEKKENKKYVLILDDINRGMISDIIGETMLLMEQHGNEKYHIILKSGRIITIPPNFYIIGTLNSAIQTPFKIDYGLQRRFHKYTIESDINYILKNEYDDSEESKEVRELYERVKRLVRENLDNHYKDNTLERDNFIIGHGYFIGANYKKRIRRQVIPLLRQYIKDGVLVKEANIKITNLEIELTPGFTTNLNFIQNDRITGSKSGVTAQIFVDEEKTHIPFINIIGRIKEQGLLADTDIEQYILFNNRILFRENIEGGITYSASLVASAENWKHLRVGKRALYKKNEIHICGEPFYIAGEMQPKEFTNWDDQFATESYINRRQSTSPNSILFFIIKYYYHCFINNCKGYLQEFPEDTSIRMLHDFACKEWKTFENEYKEIKPASANGEDNKKANQIVRECISRLKLLWNDIGNKIESEDVIVKGVYKMDNNSRYDEYINTMDTLNINQMILQGPPGTSKTYSTREFLKFLGGNISEEQLNELQIKNYNNEKYCEHLERNNDKPKIAWDIVQFHPSYGYEDFVRGIEVSTKEENVLYSTVNKILGKIANLASKESESGSATKFFLVVDEINRANLATVFGELIYGLEYRGEGVATPYTVDNSNKLALPNNLYIIGTMNTADKSIGGIDYAIRRRFLFFSLLPDEEVILNHNLTNYEVESEQHTQQRDLNNEAKKLFESVEKLFTATYLNTEFYKEDVQIGHTYFLVDDDEQLYKRFKYQIIPILREYVKDGILQIDVEESDLEGFNGFLNCILGHINIEKRDTTVREIFEYLKSSQGN